MNFRIGHLIRNKKPYFGEPVLLVVDIDPYQFCTIEGPGKFGVWRFPKNRRSHFYADSKYYRRAKLLEMVILTIWGWFKTQ